MIWPFFQTDNVFGNQVTTGKIIDQQLPCMSITPTLAD